MRGQRAGAAELRSRWQEAPAQGSGSPAWSPRLDSAGRAPPTPVLTQSLQGRLQPKVDLLLHFGLRKEAGSDRHAPEAEHAQPQARDSHLLPEGPPQLRGFRVHLAGHHAASLGKRQG